VKLEQPQVRGPAASAAAASNLLGYIRAFLAVKRIFVRGGPPPRCGPWREDRLSAKTVLMVLQHPAHHVLRAQPTRISEFVDEMLRFAPPCMPRHPAPPRSRSRSPA
jgi:hypothetical protein